MEKFNKWTQLARVKEFKGNELRVLIIILDYHNMKCDGVWDNTPQCVIQNELGLSRKGTYKVLKGLEDKGIITTSTNVYHSADDIVPNLTRINELIDTYESKMTHSKGNKSTHIYGNKSTHIYGNKSTHIYGNKSTHKPNGIIPKKLLKELIAMDYNCSTGKKVENSPLNDSLTNTELSETKDKGTLGLCGGRHSGQQEGWQCPYSGSTILTQDNQLPLDSIPTHGAFDVDADYDAIFTDAEDNSNAAENTPTPSETQKEAAGEPNSIADEQLPTEDEKCAQNANKGANTQSNTPTGNLTSDEIRKIQITDFKTDYNSCKAKLWNGAKFKHLAIAAVEHSNHLLFENGTRFSGVACGAYLHGKVTYKTLKKEMSEAQAHRLHSALTKLGQNIKQLGCADTLKTLQLGCADFDYTLQYYKI